MANLYDYVTTPDSDKRVDDIVQQDGLIDQLETLSLKLSDADIIHNLHQRIEDSLSYWNKATSYNLKYRRDKNVNWHRGHHRDKTYMFAYQVPYTDNEIFVGIETLVAYLAAQPPHAETNPGDGDIESKIMAKDLEDVLNKIAEDEDLRAVSENVIRNMLLKFVGVIKLWWDDDQKKICFGSVNPDNLIVDKNALQGGNPSFICQVIKISVGDLIRKYPEKRKEILSALDRSNKSTKLMNEIIVYREVWITDITSGEPIEGCVSYFRDIVLGKYLNPNWDFDNKRSNVLKFPLKPYIAFNFINDGTHWLDSTTPVEQAGPLQDILNKRGQQILENADTANGVQVFDSQAISAEAAANLTGDPNQKILLEAHKKGMTLNDAIVQLPPHMLPNYVIEDKMDIRQTIHNILGTPSQFSGTNAKDDDTDTLGESMMIKNQATGRQDAIVRALSGGYKRFFEYLAQMMKIYYSETQFFAIKGTDGEFMDVEMHSDRIGKNLTVSIENGSFLPPDKQTTSNIAVNLAKMGMIGPRFLYKDLGLKEIEDRLQDLVDWKTNPMSLPDTENKDLSDREAYVDFIALLGGDKVEPRDQPTAEHLRTHRQQLLSGKFRKAKSKIQQAIAAHIQEETQILDESSMIDMISQQQSQANMMPGMAPPNPIAQPGGPPPQAGQPPAGPPPTNVQSLMQGQPAPPAMM